MNSNSKNNTISHVLDLPNEVWGDVIGWEGWYKGSNFGRVKSLDRIIKYSSGTVRLQKGQLIKGCVNKKGYLRLNLRRNGFKKSYSVHRIIASIFLPNLENKPEVNHKDGDKLNNNIDNLEWATSKENIKHSIEYGLKKVAKGESTKHSKLTEDLVLEIRKLKGVESSERVAEKYGITYSNVCCIWRRQTWKHV